MIHTMCRDGCIRSGQPLDAFGSLTRVEIIDRREATENTQAS